MRFKRRNLIENLPIREAAIASGIPIQEIEKAVNGRLVYSFMAERPDMGYKSIYVNLTSIKNHLRGVNNEKPRKAG